MNTDYGLLSGTTTTIRDTRPGTDSVASSFRGGTVSARTGRDVTVLGSNMGSDGSATVIVGRDIAIVAAGNSTSSYSFRETDESGFMSSGGVCFSYGDREQRLLRTN